MDVMKMKAMHRPLQLSFFFHGIIFLAIFTLNISPVRTQNVLVIDFSMENELVLREGIRASTPPSLLKFHNRQSDGAPLSTANNPLNDKQQQPIALDSSNSQNTVQRETQTKEMIVSEFVSNTRTDMAQSSQYSSQTSVHESGLKEAGLPTFSISGKGDVDSSDKSRYLKAHFSYIKDLVHKHLIYPAKAKKMGWEGKVITSFIVSSNGCAKDVRISKSSGYEILDENAIKAITSASPFPKPPTEAQIIIPILYRLN